MYKSMPILLPLAFVLAGCALFRPETPARPVGLSEDEAKRVIEEIEKKRAENQEWLRSSPISYLAAIDRLDFGVKEMITVGRAADNDLRLTAEEIKPHHLRVTMDGDRFRIECVDINALFKIDEKPMREATVGPAYIQVGRFVLRISHQNFPAITVFDPQSLRFREFKGLSYFPVDLSYRYVLPLKSHSINRKTTIGSTRGNQRRAEIVGWVDFLVGDTPCRLEAMRLMEPGTPEDQVQIFFRDATSGKETYQLGRYVELKKLDDGNYLLDFNLAYNPACAFSSFYNCPVPPKSNTLKIAIRAGEMDAHYHHSQEKEIHSLEVGVYGPE